MSNSTLYLCYFGLREPLVQTQVLPYLREINKLNNLKVSLLTFEPDFKESWNAKTVETEKRRLASEGIYWHVLPYHKRPSVPATVYDVFNGARFIIKLAGKEKFDILHARAHIPAVMGGIAKMFCGGKLLFDIRGFIPEEYTDAGIWKENGMIYRSVKSAERWLLKKSDAFIVLTEKAREILFPESKNTGIDKYGRVVEVIPCCADFQRFESANEDTRKKIRRELNAENRRVIVYVGSFGGWYLTDEMLEFLTFAHLRDEKNFTLILTQREPEKVAEQLRKRGFEDKDFYVGSVSPQKIPEYLSASDVAISFIKACYSKQASSPTKIAEYLAGGLPIISNTGVGDLDMLIEDKKVGAILRGFTEKDFAEAMDKIETLLKDKKHSDHCRRTAYEMFDLEQVAGSSYRNVYKKLLNMVEESQKTQTNLNSNFVEDEI